MQNAKLRRERGHQGAGCAHQVWHGSAPRRSAAAGGAPVHRDEVQCSSSSSSCMTARREHSRGSCHDNVIIIAHIPLAHGMDNGKTSCCAGVLGPLTQQRALQIPELAASPCFGRGRGVISYYGVGGAVGSRLLRCLRHPRRVLLVPCRPPARTPTLVSTS